MPNYDYSCTQCGQSFEIFHGINEPARTSCPACQQTSLKRGIGGGSATFRFLGDGFYITDYKKECSSSSSAGCCPCKPGKD